jgi:predicted glycosyltransferase involved in capsule biosynthesis
MKKLCIVVPYRARKKHLKEFAPYMVAYLKSQGIDFTILIVEQEDGKPFNRAKLLNVGFDYTKAEYDYYCFHDVDMLPLESDYSYCTNPTHLAARAEQFNWKLPYDGYFGGVTIFDRESFQTINGYANEYWGWGAEDDDVFARCVHKGIQASRKNCSFRSLHHERKLIKEDYDKNLEKLRNFYRSIENDGINEGLSNLEYEVLDTKVYENYTKIKVKI